MPYVKIELITGRTPDQKAQVARAVTDALVTLAKARPEDVTIVFQDVAASDWAVAGDLVAPPKPAT